MENINSPERTSPNYDKTVNETCTGFVVNRITSSWIHWTPKGSQDNSEIGTCIRLMSVILKEVFGLIPEVDSNECTIMDSLVKALSESGQTFVFTGGGSN